MRGKLPHVRTQIMTASIRAQRHRPQIPGLRHGARHRPPEDVDGTSGYAQFLEAWSNPTHEEHEAMRQWAGHAFHPEKFDLQAIDKAVKTACRKARGDYLFRRQ